MTQRAEGDSTVTQGMNRHALSPTAGPLWELSGLASMPQGTELECRWVTKPTLLIPCPPSIYPHILAEHRVC